MPDNFYPPIDEEKVLLALRLSREDSSYFSNEACPYSEELKAILGKKQSSNVNTDEDQEDLEAEIRALRKELREFGDDLKAEDSSEKNTYFRLSASLLEKLITLQERAVGIKQVKQFTDAVMKVMEQVLDPDQRSEAMELLRTALSE